MVTPKSPWSVKGVPQETRSAAKIAARRAGMTIGEWLSRAVMEAAKRDVSGEKLDSGNLPAVRPGEQAPADLAQMARDAQALHVAVAGVQELKHELAERLAELDSRIAHAPGIDLTALEERLDAMEAKTDSARLLVAPLERQVRQIAERLAEIDGTGGARTAVDTDADWDTGRGRGGLFARLFED